MFVQNLLIPTLAVISGVAAQSASICSQATATINSQADATQYASCSTIRGSVFLGTPATGVINLNGPQQITGDLIVSNATTLTSFSSTSLRSVTGLFSLDSLTLLSTLSFDRLTSVGSIEWSALPALSTLTFPSFISQADSVLITNTFLSTLDGINLATVRILDINNNNRLQTFSTQVANVTESLNIDANGRSLKVSFPNLVSAANMTFRNCSTVSIPSLSSVNGSLGFYGNYFESIAAPNLTIVGTRDNTASGSLAFVANGLLSNISFPQLETVNGAAQVANNSALQNVSFPALANVGGAIDFSGNFSTPELPALADVKGGFNMQSTAQIDCSTFDSLSGNVIQGVYECSTTADPQSGLGSGTTTGSGSSSSPTSSRAAAASYGINEAVAGLSVVGGLLQMLL